MNGNEKKMKGRRVGVKKDGGREGRRRRHTRAWHRTVSREI